MTYEELKERLVTVDELTLLEWLDVTSEELVVYLESVIEEKQDELREKFQDEKEEDE